MHKSEANPEMICPCCSSDKTKRLFSKCCQNYIERIALPETAEMLMRSRYSAYVIENSEYLLDSWHPDTSPDNIEFDPKTKWLGLKVILCTKGKKHDNEGWVKFVARYKVDGKAHRLEEHSYFTKSKGQWLYISAKDFDMTSK